MRRQRLSRALILAGLTACSRDIARAPAVREVFGADVPATVAVRFATTRGDIRCVVEPRHAPRAAAMFVGLARGTSPHRDPVTGRSVRGRYFDGRAVFRRIDGLLVQGGSPTDDATGTPGYRIPVEVAPDDAERLAAPGVLFLARYHPPPYRTDPHPPPPGDVIGSQWVIALGTMAHLAGTVTVLGRCTDLGVVAAIAGVAPGAEAPRVSRVVVGD